MIKQKAIGDSYGIPSAHDSERIFTPHFDGTKWICDGNKGPCEHFRYYHTSCRHILIKLLEQKGKYTGGVQDTSLESYLELLNDPDFINEMYKKILVAIWKMRRPSTDREIARHLLENDPNRIRPRRNELADPYHFHHPLVREAGKRKCDVTNKSAIVWDLSEEGRKLTKENYV